jgi:hypothetical protein
MNDDLHTSGDQQRAVREAAYRKWERAGRPESDGVAFWLQAERELLSQHGKAAIDRDHALIVRPKALPKPAKKQPSRKKRSKSV